MLQFNRAKLPERTVHARGFAAKGYFEVCSAPALFHPFCESATVDTAVPCTVVIKSSSQACRV